MKFENYILCSGTSETSLYDGKIKGGPKVCVQILLSLFSSFLRLMPIIVHIHLFIINKRYVRTKNQSKRVTRGREKLEIQKSHSRCGTKQTWKNPKIFECFLSIQNAVTFSPIGQTFWQVACTDHKSLVRKEYRLYFLWI